MSEFFFFLLWLIPIFAVIATGLCVFIAPNKTNVISKSSYYFLLWITIIVNVLNIYSSFSHNTVSEYDDASYVPTKQENIVDDIDTIKQELESLTKFSW